jgi:hypothetical protein
MINNPMNIPPNGYPFHTRKWDDIVEGWKARTIRSQAWTIPGRFRSLMSGSPPKPNAANISVACGGRMASFARTVE